MASGTGRARSETAARTSGCPGGRRLRAASGAAPDPWRDPLGTGSLFRGSGASLGPDGDAGKDDDVDGALHTFAGCAHDNAAEGRALLWYPHDEDDGNDGDDGDEDDDELLS